MVGGLIQCYILGKTISQCAIYVCHEDGCYVVCPSWPQGLLGLNIFQIILGDLTFRSPSHITGLHTFLRILFLFHLGFHSGYQIPLITGFSIATVWGNWVKLPFHRHYLYSLLILVKKKKYKKKSLFSLGVAIYLIKYYTSLYPCNHTQQCDQIPAI